MVDFSNYTPSNDIDAGDDDAAKTARRLVDQWRRNTKAVPCDAAYLIAKEIRTVTEENQRLQSAAEDLLQYLDADKGNDNNFRLKVKAKDGVKAHVAEQRLRSLIGA